MNLYQKYCSNGFSVIPEEDGVPLVKWSEYMVALPTEAVSKGWFAEGYGLVCGLVSGIVALDIDTDDTNIIGKVEALAGVSPLKKKGSKGFTAFYKYNNEKSFVWKENGKVVLELLSDKRKTTIPPSKHRVSGKKYTWIAGEDLTHDLPTLPANFIGLMDLLFPSPQKQDYKIYTESLPEREIKFDDLEDILGHISPDLSYAEWLAIGMAIKDEFGDAGYNSWDNWSGRGTKYKKGECWIKWRSFGAHGYTIGTLVYFAQTGGFLFKRQEVEVDFNDYDFSYLNKPKLNLDLRAHGLVGEIADWITSTAIRPQPVLSLAAALTFVAVLKGHKYATSTNLRTNLLCLSLAKTSAGKEHPQNCIHRLIKAAGLGNLALGEPTSGAGLLTGLKESGRVGILVLDEVGRYIANATDPKAQSFQREIIDYIIKSFSKANGVLIGKQYADTKKNPRIDIVQPHLCFLGSTVKEKMLQACTSTDAIDGFLNRWIIFESSSRPEASDQQNYSQEPPAALVAKIKEQAIKFGVHGDPYGLEDEPMIKTVHYTTAALEVMQAYSRRIEKLLNELEYPMDALYSRSREHVAKIALTLCDNEYIRQNDVELAIGIVEESSKLVASFTGMIADNTTEADYIRVREIIKREKLISKRDLTRKTQFLGSQKRRHEILQDLIETGIIDLERKEQLQMFRFIV